ncbi:UV radiation resistance protein and autophagy-related subunit 14-domain-containing protein [Mycena rebaudengoi]|nr:UV radiation resistance protein and autophagy-related subunit 14-domain-containing protein [Mycena rebaudengoi]
MDCQNCELKQRQFFCTNCVRVHTRDFRLKTQHFAAERDEQVAKSTKALGGVEAARIRRAGVAQIQARVDEVLSALARLRKDNDKKRDRLRTLRESLAERRRTLSAASATSAPAIVLAAPLAALHTLSAHIARARAGLVQELIEVFHVVEVGGRPPIGGKAGSAGEWTIGDLILPVPGDVRRYPPQHINAVLGHAIRFVGLLAWYLGVKLPFDVKWEGGRVGVGVPWIGPGVGGWGRWTAHHPLHLSLSSNPTPTLALSPPPDDPPQFTTALAMLLYNVLYLAHTQAIEIPLAQAGDVLSNLWAICCSSELGRRSHATSSLPRAPLPQPTPRAVPQLDFGQVLQVTAQGGGRRRAAGVRHVGDAVGMGRGHGRRGSGEGKGKSKGEREQEDEWDMVSEDGY